MPLGVAANRSQLSNMKQRSLQLPIYLDYMATTPVDPRVAESMIACLQKEGVFGNPASRTHRYGWEAAECIQKAREQVAQLINADAREIIWTSGSTEADNLAIKGAALFYQRKGKHLITMTTEHKAVLDTCSYLATQGFEVTYLDPESNGVVDIKKLEAAIRPDTILASIMHVNNETGVIQDIATVGEITRRHGVLFHVDAAQSAGKIPIDLSAWKVDLMSFSGHKIYGPKGIGALFVRRNPRVRLEAQIHGGGHESGMRSGTLPTHQIAGMGEAFAVAKQQLSEDTPQLLAFRKRFLAGLIEIGGIRINSGEAPCIPGCMNICVEGVNGEALISGLRDIAVSSGSACNSANPNPSHVLRAMGLSREDANNSLRISFGRFTTEAEIEYALAHLSEQIRRLRQMSPIWDKVKEKIIRGENSH